VAAGIEVFTLTPLFFKALAIAFSFLEMLIDKLNRVKLFG
jgi:hypothetical protein